jgi:beta-lactamase regulating signal transducer with metallopeptidase domain
MNDLGLTLLWLTMQEGILLGPALVVNALASRRGPAAGAQVAVLSLGLVVALNVAALLSSLRWNDNIFPSQITRTLSVAKRHALPNRMPTDPRFGVMNPAAERGPVREWFVRAWDRLSRGAAEPPVRIRPWGSTVAVVALAGTTIGLLQLTVGLWAIALCCRRGREIDNPEMIGLLEELRSAMGCGRPVALREVPDLTSPATAGRQRPIVLLPDNWRSWSAAERRAVLAHELAHIVRGDYLTSLLGRLAVMLNYFNPLIRWMAGRLQLQQEQAADAMGARFAGGAMSYLVALASLALRQDGRSPRWPVRAFLPARGTLIRRIAMLRNLSIANRFDRPLLGARRMVTILGLLCLTIVAAALRRPAHAAPGSPARAAGGEAAPTRPRETSKLSQMPFVRVGSDGVVVIRPAAAFHHPGMERILPLCQRALDEDFLCFGEKLKVDTNRPGFVKLRCQDIDWLTAAIHFDESPPQIARGKKVLAVNGKRKEPLHRISFGSLAIRMLAPFDWLAFLRQWRLECEEVRVEGRVYFKITGELKKLLGPNPSLILLDDRTIVFDEENAIREIAGVDEHAPPAYIRSKEWERASRALAVLAVDNRNGAFAKHYDLGRADDALVLSLFKGLYSWIICVDDADAINLHAQGVCRDRDATLAVSRSLESLISLGRRYVEQNTPNPSGAGTHDLIATMLRTLAANVRIEHTDDAIAVLAQGFGTLSDFARIVEGEL